MLPWRTDQTTLQLLRLHANTGIDHPGNQGFGLAITADDQGDRAAFREFQRICTQIDDDLPVSGWVRADLLRQRILADNAEIQAFLPGPWLEERADFIQQLRQVHRHHIHVQLVGVDLGVVQDIVHQLQQVPATAYHGFGAAALSH